MYTIIKKILFITLLFVSQRPCFTNNFNQDTNVKETSLVPLMTTSKDSLRAEKDTFCVVFYVNSLQIQRFIITYKELRTRGRYRGDVVLIICDDIEIQDLRKQQIFDKVNIIKFKNIKPAANLYQTFNIKHKTSKVQPQINKFYVFHSFFKRWDYVLYIDCGMSIWRSIRPIRILKEKGRFIAQSDTYPSEPWTLQDQFNRDSNPDCFNKLSVLYNLNEDYPQSGVMLFDTSLINNNTLSDLINLMHLYPIANNNDQSYIALYFTQILKVWKPMQPNNQHFTYYFIFKRDPNTKYIMTKYDSPEIMHLNNK